MDQPPNPPETYYKEYIWVRADPAAQNGQQPGQETGGMGRIAPAPVQVGVPPVVVTASAPVPTTTVPTMAPIAPVWQPQPAMLPPGRVLPTPQQMDLDVQAEYQSPIVGARPGPTPTYHAGPYYLAIPLRKVFRP